MPQWFLMILVAGQGGEPVTVPVGSALSEAACIEAGQAIVDRTLTASAPGVTAQWFCIPVEGVAA